MKKGIVLFLLFFLLILSGCPSGLGTEKGTLNLTMRAADDTRTIVPSVTPYIDSYLITLSGPKSLDPVSTTDATVEVSLLAGTWDITVEALDTIDNTIATYSRSDVVISSGSSTSITAGLAPTQEATGTVDITVTWPGAVSITADDIEVLFDSDTIPMSNDTITLSDESLNYHDASVASGNGHVINICVTANETPVSIIESVHVYDYLETSAEFALTEEDFGIVSSYSRIADHSIIHELWDGAIPEDDIQLAKDNLHIAYWHTSHGSQIVKAMESLVSFANGGHLGGRDYSQGLFELNETGSGGALHLDEVASKDLGEDNWATITRTYLNNPDNDEINVVVWSWCGQVHYYYKEEDMHEKYLDPMHQLEQDYPGVAFIYMTGHAEGTGDTGEEASAHAANQIIRQYCIDNDKWLFDFYDIECYDPEGEYYGDRYVTDGCNYDYDGDGDVEEIRDPEDSDRYIPDPEGNDRNWAIDWQDSHDEGEDWFECVSTHTQPLNGNMKAYAAWWLFAQIADYLE